MAKVTIDDVLRQKLGDLREPLEFCDEEGRVVGTFRPPGFEAGVDDPNPRISDEELSRREQEPDSYTTEDVLSHLERL